MGLAETGDVEISSLGCLIRRMERNAPVKPEDEEVQVVTYADACTYCEVAEEFARLEPASAETLHEILHFLIVCRIMVGVILKRPHIAGIKEKGTIQRAKESGTILKVHHELYISHVGKICHVLIRDVGTSRSDAAGRESADRVGSPYIEIFRIC